MSNARVGGVHAQCACGGGCMCNAHVGGACAMRAWGVHAQCMHGGARAMHVWEGAHVMRMWGLHTWGCTCNAHVVGCTCNAKASNLIGCGGDT